MTRTDLEQLDSRLNSLNLKGKILEGLDEFYADDCSFREGNGEPVQGKAAQRERLSTMFASLKSFNGATLHAQTIGDDVTLTEWTFDMTGGDGEPMLWNEVLARRWADGKVIDERFYQAS